MATKEDPGKYDCYNNAAPDEPIFTLRATDPAAPWLIEIWRQLRTQKNDFATFTNIINAACNALRDLADSNKEPLPLRSEKSEEAWRCAKDMRQWRFTITDRPLQPPTEI